MAKYEDAPTEIAPAIEQSTTIKETHMPQPEITFRHGLDLGAGLRPRRREIDRPHCQLSAFLPRQRRQLADHQQLESQ